MAFAGTLLLALLFSIAGSSFAIKCYNCKDYVFINGVEYGKECSNPMTKNTIVQIPLPEYNPIPNEPPVCHNTTIVDTNLMDCRSHDTQCVTVVADAEQNVNVDFNIMLRKGRTIMRSCVTFAEILQSKALASGKIHAYFCNTDGCNDSFNEPTDTTTGKSSASAMKASLAAIFFVFLKSIGLLQ